MALFEMSINEEWDIVYVRQKIREHTKSMGFNIVDQTRIVTAVSELSRNIYVHAGKGRVLVDEEHDNYRKGLKISFIDAGPGIKDIDLAMKSGYSSGKGLGLGLPGTRNLVDEFDISSEVGKGTVVVIIKWL